MWEDAGPARWWYEHGGPSPGETERRLPLQGLPTAVRHVTSATHAAESNEP